MGPNPNSERESGEKCENASVVMAGLSECRSRNEGISERLSNAVEVPSAKISAPIKWTCSDCNSINIFSTKCIF